MDEISLHKLSTHSANPVLLENIKNLRISYWNA